MRALVTTASKHGATAEIGPLIGDVLNEAGIETTVRPVETVTDLDGYDAVVLGSAVDIWGAGWNRPGASSAGSRAPSRHATSGSSLADRSVTRRYRTPNPTTQRRCSRPRRRDHRTFAGRLVSRDLRFGERAITKVVRAPAGDFIPREEIRSWASEIARTLLDGSDEDRSRALPAAGVVVRKEVRSGAAWTPQRLLTSGPAIAQAPRVPAARSLSRASPSRASSASCARANTS